MATKVAVIQKPPVLLNREKTIARTLESIEEAAREGASLLVFPEAYIPGYPTWIWQTQAWRRHGALQRDPRQAAPECR